MREAAKKAGIKLSDIDFVEAHATGTKVGDKLECNAIANTHKERGVSTNEKSHVKPLLVASVKSNIGHILKILIRYYQP